MHALHAPVALQLIHGMTSAVPTLTLAVLSWALAEQQRPPRQSALEQNWLCWHVFPLARTLLHVPSFSKVNVASEHVVCFPVASHTLHPSPCLQQKPPLAPITRALRTKCARTAEGSQ